MRLGKYLSSLTKPELDEIEKICNFTEDEEQIFKCISKGYTLRQIEMKCNMSESTVIRRVSRIDWKINKAKEMIEVKDTSRDYAIFAIIRLKTDIRYAKSTIR